MNHQIEKMKVIAKGEYSPIIRRYFQGSLPKTAVIKGKDLLEILTTILLGSKDQRYGPKPSPESLVAIRVTIQKAVELGLPIPVLVPWGGRKMDKDIKLDIAEVSAIRQLLSVDECVRNVYPPGLQIRVRIEDINAEWLYKDSEGIEEYSSGMQKLITMTKGDTKIIGIVESEMMDKGKYMKLATSYSILLSRVIGHQIASPDVNVWDIPEYQKLAERGWKGDIPKEQRDYYLDRYKRIEPNISDVEAVMKLADYFAGSKVRYDLNGRGNPQTEVGSFIQINFAHPVPGAPEAIFNNTLYYRTIPGNLARTHIAPWRAKGYLAMIDDQVTPKLVNPGAETKELRSNTVMLVNENNETDTLLIQADYTYSENVFAMPYILPVMM